MNKTINKLKDGVLFWIWALFVFWIANAWVNLSTVGPGDSLTDTIWNEMVTKLNDTWQRASGIFTDWSSNVWIWTNTPTSKLDVEWKIRWNATYSYDPSSTTLSFTNTSAATFSDIQTSIVVQNWDIVKVDLACNLRNDTAYMVTYMRAWLYSWTATTKIWWNRITTWGWSAVSEWIWGSSMWIFKASADWTLIFRAEWHVSWWTWNAVYCNIIAYVIGKE